MRDRTLEACVPFADSEIRRCPGRRNARSHAGSVRTVCGFLCWFIRQETSSSKRQLKASAQSVSSKRHAQSVSSKRQAQSVRSKSHGPDRPRHQLKTATAASGTGSNAGSGISSSVASILNHNSSGESSKCGPPQHDPRQHPARAVVISHTPGRDLEDCIRNSKDAYDPTPHFGADVKAFLDSRPGH